MKLTERKWGKCSKCGKNDKLIQEETYGCDTCQKFLLLEEDDEYLRVQLFKKNEFGGEFQFCSWKCALKKLKRMSSDDFITLPYLTYDSASGRRLSKEFFKYIDWKKVGAK